VNEVIYLDVDDLLVVAARATGIDVQVRDYGLLESAAYRPQATVFGIDAYPSLHDKAGALLHSLALNHALVDGDKRLAWSACALFYAMNDVTVLDAPEDDIYDLVLNVATGNQDVPKIAAILGGWAQPRH